MTEILSFLAVCAALWFVTRRNEQMREKTAEELRTQLVRRALLTGFGALSVVCGTLTVNHLAPQMFAAIGPGGLGGIIEGVRKTARRGGGGGGGCTYTSPNTPTVDAVVFAITGDSLRLVGNAFVGSCDDTHDSTQFQVDTAGGTFASPQYHSVVLGAVTTDTAIGIDSAAVVDIRMRYKGAAAKSATWSGWDTLAGVSMTLGNYKMTGDLDTLSFEWGSFDTISHVSGSNTLAQRSSVVTDSATNGEYCVVWNDGGAVSPASCFVSATGTPWTSNPRTGGNFALRRRFAAGGNTGEWYFKLASPQTELYVRYWFRVPPNYEKPTDAALLKDNDKFFVAYNDAFGYDNGGGGTVTFQLRPSERNNNPTDTVTMTVADGGTVGGETQSNLDVLIMPRDSARWGELCYHLKMETTNTAQDGIIRQFLRWDGATTWDTIFNITNADSTFHNTGTPGFDEFRFIGYMNTAPAVSMAWLLDDIQFSTTNLCN